MTTVDFYTKERKKIEKERKDGYWEVCITDSEAERRHVASARRLSIESKYSRIDQGSFACHDLDSGQGLSAAKNKSS